MLMHPESANVRDFYAYKQVRKLPVVDGGVVPSDLSGHAAAVAGAVAVVGAEGLTTS